MTNTYKVTITREGDHWLSDVPDVAGAHTYAGSLASLMEATREVIILMDDLADDADVRLLCSYDVDDPIVLKAVELGAWRDEHEAAGAQIVDQTAKVARELVDHKVSMRDAAALLHITPGRVSQLARAAKPR